VEGITTIESSLGTRQGDPLGGPLFALAHYWTLLETIVRVPSCVFPSLIDDNHIVGLVNEIIHAFDLLSNQLTLLGLSCTLESIRNLSKNRIFSRLYFGHRWFMHFGCGNGFLGLCHSFFGWSFISGCYAYRWSSSPKRCPGCLGHFVLVCGSSTFLFHIDNMFFFFLPISFNEFQQENYTGMWGHYGSKTMGVFSGPLSEVLSSTTNILSWYRPFFYGGLCPI
jgi:hypothetical protein